VIDDAPPIRRTPVARRPSPAQLAALAGVPTGFVVDALGGRGALDYRIKPVIAGQDRFCGPALTCDAGPADNLAIFAALDSLSAGDVIVAATGGHTGCAAVGDLLLGMARNGGAVALVSDGCVRDLAGIREVALPCFAVGVSPNSPARNGPGSVGHPVVLGSVAIATGDLLVGDPDGVVVVPFERIDEVIGRLDAVRAAESALDAQVKAGLRRPPFLPAR
jgi:4-hydroxy-4-methyl-2-oxoglutarate aldolase